MSLHAIEQTQLRKHVASTAWDARNSIFTQVALLFPVARDALKHVVGETWAMSTLFAVFAAIAVYALEFVRARVPETKGLSLEEIERYFAAGERLAGIESPLISQGDELVM